MGGSISKFLYTTPRDDIFLHPTGKDVYANFVHEDNATHSFAQFVKNGTWLSILTHHDHHASKSAYSDAPTLTPRNSDSEWMYHYFVIPDSLKAFVGEYLKNADVFIEPVVMAGSSKKAWSNNKSLSFHESYKYNPETAIFTLGEMSAIMCSILFPLYLQSEEFLHWSDSRTNSPHKNSSNKNSPSKNTSSKNTSSKNNNAMEVNTALFFTNGSSKDATQMVDLSGEVPEEVVGSADMEHMKQMLLGTAAFLDESEIAAHFSKGHSFVDAENAIAQAALGVCILSVGTELEDSHIMYANRAFEKSSGHYFSQLSGQSLSTLLGANTEDEAKKQLHTAFQEKRAAKVVLSAYRRNASKFTAALALKPAFSDQGQCKFWICLCYDLSKRPASLDELKKFEDLLALIPNLLNYDITMVI